jgi:hypothetical protein
MKPFIKAFLSLLVILTSCLHSYAQKDSSATSILGDAAPPLRVREWIKGTPVKDFEKGKIYVQALYCVNAPLIRLGTQIQTQCNFFSR